MIEIKQTSHTDVFISYSRKDSDFVRKLQDSLLEKGKEAWVDWQRIAPSAEWIDVIYGAIESSDTFIFVISHESSRSATCMKEIAHAEKCCKRIIPIVIEGGEPEILPPIISKKNWLFFTDESEFEKSVNLLIKANETDLEWVREHTRLLMKAVEWEDSHDEKSYLVHGEDLKNVEIWLSNDNEQQEPFVTRLHLDFIMASQQLRRGSNRKRMILVTLALIIASLLAIWAVIERSTASRQRDYAFEQEQVALEQASISHSRFLMNYSYSLRDREYDLALLLGMEADRLNPSWSAKGNLLGILYSSPIERYIARFPGELMSSNSFALSPDGRYIAVAGSDSMFVIDTTDNSVSSVTGVCSPVAFMDKDGAVIATTGYPCYPGIINIGGKLEVDHIFNRGVPKFCHCHLFDPATGLIVSSFYEHGIEVFNIADGSSETLVERSTFETTVYDLCLLNSPGLIASCGVDGLVITWDLFSMTAVDTLFYSDTLVCDIDYCENTQMLAIAELNGDITLLSGDSFNWYGYITAGNDVGMSGVRCIELSTDGMFLAAGGHNNSIQMYDISDPAHPELFNEYKGIGSDLHTIRFDPNGSIMYSLHVNGSLIAWNLEANNPVSQFVFLSENSGIPEVIMPTDSTLMFIEAEAGILNEAIFQGDSILFDTLAVTRETLQSFALDPASGKFALGCWNGNILIFDSGSPEPFISIPNAHTSLVSDLEFNLDGTILASCSWDGRVNLWDVLTGELLYSSKPFNPLMDMKYSPDGGLLAVTTSDSEVLLFDTNEFSEPTIVRLENQKYYFYALAFSIDGSILAVAGTNEEIILLDVATLAPVGDPMVTGQGCIFSLDFSSSTGLLAAGSEDGSITLWDINDQIQICEPLTGSHGQILWSLDFSPSGDSLITASLNGSIFLTDMSPSSWERKAEFIANRELSDLEISKYIVPILESED